MITLDIKDLYVNIPIQEVMQITNMILQYNNTETVLKQQTTRALNTILLQNYFQYKNNIYQPNKGIAMGSPISGIVAEIFLQHFENLLSKHHLENRSLIYYTRYVDDILIIYDTTKIQYHQTIQQANMLHKNLTFNYTLETNNIINFLDLSILRTNSKFQIDIYRKPTTTDTITHYHSNHPLEHKTAAFRFLINRIQLLPLNPQQKQIEW